MNQKKSILKLGWFVGCFSGLVAAILCLTGCEPKVPKVEKDQPANTNKPQAQVNGTELAATPDPCSIILLPTQGATSVDQDISKAQQVIKAGGFNAFVSIEKLGWLYVSKARSTFDPGYYKLAEQCALCMADKEPTNLAALLLRGHVLDSMHRFKEAEPIARELVAKRGLSFDYGLLGDVLMEMGRLDEAIEVYQKMIDLRPDLHSYARVAHVRWLKGDLQGATEVMQMAVQATSPKDAETAAWVYSRMANYQLQAGNIDNALKHSEAALEFQKDYAPALLAKGRLLLADHREEEAIEPLRRAVALNPLPDYQWTLAEALRATGKPDAALENQIKQMGPASDPRTASLYLASTKQDPATAVRLAQEELNNRGDVQSHDALAWALASAGQYEEAAVHSDAALAEGTQDARMFYHAGIIEENRGNSEKAMQLLIEAHGYQQMLLPSERDNLTDHLTALGLNLAGLEPQIIDSDRKLVATGK
ncbi:tetratricopeptide repeat protein [Pedosphaera parvula]|uniref:Tetratricopeptide TPR_2 repeat protein n=1 Tax=Pedosphaera parvula (strain Ellin514) TaxID=320771 RepID=B9XQX3_PEDPL|nr:tetratricopeptide repeat protein [Pedosphaera parvula]EEF57750.1 Tetratricopeptide TPR_2 repeat protein [Pedosphaera parvula Ellin514]